eukprot:1160615-Pelagomonas_calceolata.AAC.2
MVFCGLARCVCLRGGMHGFPTHTKRELVCSSWRCPSTCIPINPESGTMAEVFCQSTGQNLRCRHSCTHILPGTYACKSTTCPPNFTIQLNA